MSSFKLSQLKLTHLRALVCCVAILSCLRVEGADAKTVKVGVVLPYTGIVADSTKLMVEGMKLYYKLHKADLGGNEIDLIERDSKEGSGATAQTVTRELIVRDNVDILAGYFYSPDAIASAPIAAQAQKLMLLGLAQSSFITTMSPYIVRLSASSWQVAYPMGKYSFDKLACKTAVVGYPDFPPGKDAVAAFTMSFETAGGKVIDSIAMGGPLQVPDYTPFLRRLKDDNPACAFIFTPSGSFNIAFARAAREVGLTESGIHIVGTIDLTPDSGLQAIGPDAVGWMSTGHYTSDLNTPANKQFVADFYAAYGNAERPDFFAVQGYDLMAAIFHVVEALDGDIDGAKAVEALKGWKLDSPRGPISIDPQTRDIVQNIYVSKVVDVGGRIGLDVVDVVPDVKDPCKALKVGRCAAAK